MPNPTPIREWRDVSAAVFRNEILPGNQPAVIRDAVRHWPAVRAGLESPHAFATYLRGFDTGARAETMFGDPSIDGRFFYNDDLSGFNFERRSERIADSLDRLIALLDEPSPPAVYAGAVPTPQALPGFTRDNDLALFDRPIVPRIWLGNRVTVQTHFDVSSNVACVMAGRRTFTLFPPEQLENLYVGPLEFTLAGQPISMVRLDQPDVEKFPRFREAMTHAVSAELSPGDAVFIPYMWWHHVQSHDRFNAMVNYWWDETPPWNGSPFEALCHALMSIRSLPPHKRAIWQKVFNHHVFENSEKPVAHIPPNRRGIQGRIDQRMASHMRAWIIQALSGRR